MISIDLLKGFEDRIASIQKRKPAKVIKMKLPEEYKQVIAMYIKEENEILFNDLLFDKTNEVDLMAALFHEMRHAYQWNQITNKKSSTEPINLLDEWEEEFHLNLQPTNNQNDNYYKRLIEIDAIAYADLNIKNIYQTSLDIPIEIKSDVLTRESEIKHNKDIIKL
ncbi:MAG: hypothetical protein R6U15_05540 [Candidatus Izemoplasmatales bacterium]